MAAHLSNDGLTTGDLHGSAHFHARFLETVVFGCWCRLLDAGCWRSVPCYPGSSIRYPESAIHYPLSAICHPLTAICHPASDFQYPIFRSVSSVDPPATG